MILHEDSSGNPPNGTDAAVYDNGVGPLGIPVTADGSNQVLDATPWSGNARPGKCAMSPDMVMLECYTSEDDTAAFDAIKAHAGVP